ncbi:glutathione S-transferase [Annulohypoxylon maeteangense]|uniref:glutathione S-transferase n=1 Tax=Annulohypoxylon maeteangense TaxID=1927788 RepID=UPI0020081FBD|nr:glutathione S-transferase [Annulohypoxylon maeteangense]KAI0887707.1 glutathione S-transferase [Annulohypoxylon maeteangense]
MTLTVHHLGISQSDRVVWLCEELDIDYELKKYDRAPIMAPDEYKALHPLGSAPVIEDGDVKIAESGACVEYILQTWGNGKLALSPGDKDYSEYLYWFHFANGTLQPTLFLNMSMSRTGLDEANPSVKYHKARQIQLIEYMDRRLSNVPWLAGEQFTAADVMNVCCLTTMRCFAPYDLGAYPNILSYLKRVATRDGYKRAVQKGDPDLSVDQLIGATPPPMQKAVAAAIQARGRL